MSGYRPRTQAQAARVPPGRKPPTAVGVATPPPPPGPRPSRYVRSRRGPLGWLRRLEVAIFGVRRTLGPRPGPTPTF